MLYATNKQRRNGSESERKNVCIQIFKKFNTIHTLAFFSRLNKTAHYISLSFVTYTSTHTRLSHTNVNEMKIDNFVCCATATATATLVVVCDVALFFACALLLLVEREMSRVYIYIYSFLLLCVETVDIIMSGDFEVYNNSIG